MIHDIENRLSALSKKLSDDADFRGRIRDYVLVQTEIAASDVCLVFGSRIAVKDSVDKVHELWRRRFCKHIVVTGGNTSPYSGPEADFIADKIIDRGIPESSITRERQSMNTGDNVTFALQHLQKDGRIDSTESIICVGRIYASRRYLMTLQKHWPSITKSLSTTNHFGVGIAGWYEHHDFRKAIMTEYIKIEEYLRRGMITELPLPRGLAS